jgi:Na+-driven multidrug efflux pump
MTHGEFDQRMQSAPYATIWNLAWPQVVMMFFHFLIGFVDVWVAGRISREAQACMGVMSQAMFFFMVVAIALANGSVAAISQSSGAGLPRRIKRFVGLSVGLGTLTGLVILALGLLFDEHFLSLLQIPAELMPIAEYLLQVSLYILPAYYLFTISNAFFRAQKIVTLPLYSMILVTGVNTVPGPWPWAWAVGPAQPRLQGHRLGDLRLDFMRNGLQLRDDAALRPAVSPSLAPWRWIRLALPYLIKVAGPAGLMQLVWHSAYMVLYAITASLP